MEDWKNLFGEGLIQGPYGELKLLIQYGSERPNSDTDYFAVYNEEPSTQNLMIGRIDLWAIGIETFTRYLEKIDPFISEPLLTGKVLYNQNRFYKDAKKQLSSVKPSDETWSYLLSRSFEAFLQARVQIVNIENQSSSSMRDYWSTLSFSITYWAFARAYMVGTEFPLIVVEAIKKSPDHVIELWKRTIKNKKQNSPIEPQALFDWSASLLQPIQHQ